MGLTFYPCWGAGTPAAAANTGAAGLLAFRSMPAPSEDPDPPDAQIHLQTAVQMWSADLPGGS